MRKSHKNNLGQKLAVEYRHLSELKPLARNPRTHSKHQIRQIARSIEEFGFNNPLLLDQDDNIVAGHGRLAGAALLGIPRVPTIRLGDLSPDQLRAYVVADNRLAEKAGWDESILAIELQHLLAIDDDFDVTVTGFEVPEIDQILSTPDSTPDPDDEFEIVKNSHAITRLGSLWQLGRHRIFCGDSTKANSYSQLLGSKRADVVFTDPPYNVKINGNVSGKGSIRHREFRMGSGEMSEPEFVAFLTSAMTLLAAYSAKSSVHFVCMDWRHISEITAAGKEAYGSLLNVCVWVKSNGGMGSLYRSQHELVFVFRNGKAGHRNNVQLGRYGRNRNNVWQYPSVSTPAKNGDEGNLLALHPTVKPIALVADALLDCSARGDLVLDGFLGSGSTLMAAERTGRSCYGIELDPIYVDTAIRRWQRYTGDHAVDAASGKRFDDLLNKTKEDNHA
jgi:DNA modification methylase